MKNLWCCNFLIFHTILINDVSNKIVFGVSRVARCGRDYGMDVDVRIKNRARDRSVLKSEQL
jgi:hypothetical protein